MVCNYYGAEKKIRSHVESPYVVLFKRNFSKLRSLALSPCPLPRWGRGGENAGAAAPATLPTVDSIQWTVCSNRGKQLPARTFSTPNQLTCPICAFSALGVERAFNGNGGARPAFPQGLTSKRGECRARSPEAGVAGTSSPRLSPFPFGEGGQGDRASERNLEKIAFEKNHK